MFFSVYTRSSYRGYSETEQDNNVDMVESAWEFCRVACIRNMHVEYKNPPFPLSSFF